MAFPLTVLFLCDRLVELAGEHSDDERGDLERIALTAYLRPSHFVNERSEIFFWQLAANLLQAACNVFPCLLEPARSLFCEEV
ncbi:MAG: hypothetical protein M3P26_15300 [Gemmatimonadota bacterium]|nr:hypothetical protein [Gemmatimonadota bacterium]